MAAISIMSPVKQKAAAQTAAASMSGSLTRIWKKRVPIAKRKPVEMRQPMKQASAFPASTCARLTGARRRRRKVPVSRS
jgi:hypothetical protein